MNHSRPIPKIKPRPMTTNQINTGAFLWVSAVITRETTSPSNKTSIRRLWRRGIILLRDSRPGSVVEALKFQEEGVAILIQACRVMNLPGQARGKFTQGDGIFSHVFRNIGDGNEGSVFSHGGREKRASGYLKIGWARGRDPDRCRVPKPVLHSLGEMH